MGRNQATCRLRRISPTVQLFEYQRADGSSRLSVGGVHTCKSPLCPLCAPKYQRTRSEEIATAIDHWGAKRVAFVTLTVRHDASHQVGLLHRLLTHAFGSLWSGRAGQELAAALGSKPESIRAHDRTWSVEHGWHPHLHCLLFLDSPIDESELGARLSERWTQSLRSRAARMRQVVELALGAGDLDERAENKLRERLQRVFGKTYVPDHVPVKVSAKAIEKAVAKLTSKAVLPNVAHGVRVEYVRRPDRTATYLAKMGLELSWTIGKTEGSRDARGVDHYGLWQVAQLCTIHGDARRGPARRAWKHLFRDTFGTATITFSNRERLGLNEDPYAEDGEPVEASADETERMLAEVPGVVWTELSRRHKHGLLVTLHVAHRKGVLRDLPWVQAESDLSPRAMGRPSAQPRGPPEDWWHHQIRMARRKNAGRERWRAAQSPRPDPPERQSGVERELWVEELRHRLVEMGILG